VARARAAAGPSPSVGGWALLAQPSRPLDRSLILDLAAALAEEGGPLDVLAPFGPSAAAQRWPAVQWSELEDSEPPSGADSPWTDRARSEAHLLAAIRPAWASHLATSLAGRSPSSFLLPIDASTRGAREALSQIRQLRGAAPERIGAFIVGGQNGEDGLLDRIRAEALRDLRVEVEPLGAVVRDAASYRALLFDTPVLEVDRESTSARSVRALARTILGAT
jgi:hypothetical protein